MNSGSREPIDATSEHRPCADAQTEMLAHGAGDRVGPYQLEALLGTGGMGRVYRATDTRLNRKVAVKITTEHFQERFEREARAIAAFNHPHICTLYDVGPNCIVMELLEGSTLAEEIRKGPLKWEQVLQYGVQIALALKEAHACGIVHRDLKPSNIMVTRHGVKVMDFGLARMASESKLTAVNTFMGTPEYMAPEQMLGWEADERSDLFALGLVLYEMAARKLPVPGRSLGRMLAEGSIMRAPRLSEKRADTTPTMDALVAKILEPKPTERLQSATELAALLSAEAERKVTSSGLLRRSFYRPGVLVPLMLLLVVAILAGMWAARRSNQRRWAREAAIPEIQSLLAAKKPLAAFEVLQRAERSLPGYAQLAEVARTFTQVSSINSTKPGAKVEMQDYLAPGEEWHMLGATPLVNVTIPSGYFRWRLSQPGRRAFISAPLTNKSISFSFPPAANQPPDMVAVPGGAWGDLVGFVGWMSFQLPAFEMDRFEVTNAEYQKFVDAGGYQKREYWRERFVKDARELTWEEAMNQFRDPTGRPGPSTWRAGHFPPGRAEYPVSGVSWYEASAYLTFVHKTLPALGQWFKAAPNDVARYTINQSRFGGNGPLPVGASRAVGVFGTYDLEGNVREWVLNTVDGDRRFILGGAWGTQTYQAYEPEALPPFDRSVFNGVRGVRNQGLLSADAAGPIVRRSRDFSKVKPASDQVFQLYRAMYAYDRTQLNEESGPKEDSADWSRQKVTIDGGFDYERLPMYLLLPKRVHPPYQTIVFFPSARVNTMPSSQHLGDLDFIDYVIQSGRAVVYPIYRGTYERHTSADALPGDVGDRELTIRQSKEVRRAVDYLETRPDLIDRNKLAYLGVSQGSAAGVIFTALEDRFKAAIFLDGGFFLNPALPGRDQADFAARLKKPVLMVNGKYDFTFPPDQAQAPMFQMIGTPPADKHRVLLETPHDVTQDKPDLTREVLAFLDRYLGRVE